MNTMVDRFQRMRDLYADAVTHAPALAARFSDAGLTPADLGDEAALSLLSALKKETLIERQAANPPFAGFLGCRLDEVAHVFVSPGPIFEPWLAGEDTGQGMDMMFRAAGIGPGDVALNTWSYHLVPAGLLFGQGFRKVGGTVIPAGTGNTELQARIMVDLKPTAYIGSAPFLRTIIAALEGAGRSLPTDWGLKHAFLAGEIAGWDETRQGFEDRYGLKTWSAYGTADFGLIGYEEAELPGYTIHPDRFVQICDPATGVPVGPDEPGEVVVTTLSRGWPMIRFGTGDVARALEHAGDGGVARMSGVEGRVGTGVKVREIFVYHGHIASLVAAVVGLRDARAAVERRDGRDTIVLELLAGEGFDTAALEDEVHARFRALTRLKADTVTWVGSAEDFSIATALENRRDR